MTINGTNGDDVITLTDNNGVVTVTGLAETVTITGFEANDRIVINGLGGDDVIEASGFGTAMQLIANGGDGDDVLIGSPGNDTLTGGDGDDILIGNGGQDVARRRTRQQRCLQGCRLAQAPGAAEPVHGVELRPGRSGRRPGADRRIRVGASSRRWPSRPPERNDAPERASEHDIVRPRVRPIRGSKPW